MDRSEIHDLASSWEPATPYFADDGLKAFGFVLSIDAVDGHASEDPFAWQKPLANERIIQARLKHLDDGMFGGYQGVLVNGM